MENLTDVPVDELWKTSKKRKSGFRLKWLSALHLDKKQILPKQCGFSVVYCLCLGCLPENLMLCKELISLPKALLTRCAFFTIQEILITSVCNQTPVVKMCAMLLRRYIIIKMETDPHQNKVEMFLFCLLSNRPLAVCQQRSGCVRSYSVCQKR